MVGSILNVGFIPVPCRSSPAGSPMPGLAHQSRTSGSWWGEGACGPPVGQPLPPLLLQPQLGTQAPGLVGAAAEANWRLAWGSGRAAEIEPEPRREGQGPGPSSRAASLGPGRACAVPLIRDTGTEACCSGADRSERGPGPHWH